MGLFCEKGLWNDAEEPVIGQQDYIVWVHGAALVEIGPLAPVWIPAACLKPMTGQHGKIVDIDFVIQVRVCRRQRPNRGRMSAIGRLPTGGFRDVIDSYIVVIIEHRCPKAGSISSKIDAGQIGAVIKRPFPDGGDAVTDDDVGQDGAVTERPVPDGGDAVADGDAGQAIAVIERMKPESGDAVGNCIGSGFALRISGEFRLAFVEQDPFYAAICGVKGIDCYCCQTGAETECIDPNDGDAAADSDAGQVAALKKHLATDGGNAVGDGDAGQTVTIFERITADGGDRQAGECTGNGDVAAGAEVISDGACAVAIVVIIVTSVKSGLCRGR